MLISTDLVKNSSKPIIKSRTWTKDNPSVFIHPNLAFLYQWANLEFWCWLLKYVFHKFCLLTLRIRKGKMFGIKSSHNIYSPDTNYFSSINLVLSYVLVVKLALCFILRGSPWNLQILSSVGKKNNSIRLLTLCLIIFPDTTSAK